MLKFPDDTKIRVHGLDGILADLYAEGRAASPETAGEIVRRLEEQKNFIPASARVRQEYVSVLLQEYRKYIEDRKNKGP